LIGFFLLINLAFEFIECNFHKPIRQSGILNTVE